ncbi:MAG TPA: FAD/NAD(P)-binding protein, partial [Candidatus Acidoferrum sp.]|nr:FAD/NAD(P)-binding protein [Candidatus Acidoferrum sp.]
MGNSEIAIVGGGCSGLLTAVQLVRHGFTGRITIVEPHEALGRGLAYSTTLDDHLLNVPAGKMSALPDQPDDFLEWLHARSWPGAAPGSFAPRRLYGEYLGGLLARFAPDAAVRHLRAEVEALETGDASARLRLNDGNTIEAHLVVLALGNPASGPALHLPPTGMEDRWHASPWIGDPLRVRKPGERILLLGTGLTAVDTILALQAHPGAPHTFLISRRANLPQVHRPGAAPASLPPLQSRRLNGLMRELRGHIA